MTAHVLWLEHTALAFNERMKLFGGISAHEVAHEYELGEALTQYRARLESSMFAIYEVCRVAHAGKDGPDLKGPVWRSVRTVSTGSRASMLAELAERAAGAGARVEFDHDGIARAVVLRREERYPTTEQLFALAPVGAEDKQLKAFEKHWARLSAAREAQGRDG